jgi:uncharacterized RmlC-like cupin family protein
MRWTLGALLAALLLTLAALAAYHQGYHRMLVRSLYARMLQGEAVAPGTIRLPPGDSPYNRWLQRNRTRIPLFEGLVMEDVTRHPLPPWPERGDGVNGLYLRFADYQLTDGRLLEIPPGGSTAPARHLYEVGTYFFAGPGYTLLEVEGEPVQRIEWRAGSLLSIPLMATYQHVNTGPEAVRLLSVTSFPFVLNAFDDENFARGSDYRFADRVAATRDFSGFREQIGDGMQRLNLVPNAIEHPTVPGRARGATNRHAYWRMAGNSMLEMHVSEFGPRSYKRAHRHSSDAFILILSGRGFSAAWAEGDIDNRVRVDWRPGTLFVPPIYWYHQHFNTSAEPARYLVINPPSLVRHLGLRFHDQLDVDTPELMSEWRLALAREPADTPATDARMATP